MKHKQILTTEINIVSNTLNFNLNREIQKYKL